MHPQFSRNNAHRTTIHQYPCKSFWECLQGVFADTIDSKVCDYRPESGRTTFQAHINATAGTSMGFRAQHSTRVCWNSPCWVCSGASIRDSPMPLKPIIFDGLLCPLIRTLIFFPLDAPSSDIHVQEHQTYYLHTMGHTDYIPSNIRIPSYWSFQ